MSVEENVRLTDEWFKAFNARDWDRFGGFFADEEFGKRYAQFEEDVWEASFPDFESEKVKSFGQGDWVFFEAIDRATNTGTLTCFVKDPIPATNKKIEFGWCCVFRWEHGKIAEFKVYFDRLSILEQLGVLETP